MRSLFTQTLKAMNSINIHNTLELLVVEAGSRARPEERWPPATVHVCARALMYADAIDSATEF